MKKQVDNVVLKLKEANKQETQGPHRSTVKHFSKMD